MGQSNDETRRLIEDTIERLEAVREDLAAEPEDVLRSFMAEEVERSLNQVPSDDRAGFLEELRDRFPSMGGPGEKQSKPERSRARGEQSSDPDGENEARKQVGMDEKPVSVEPVDEPVSSVSSTRVPVDPKLGKAIGLNGVDSMDARRAVEMLGLLAEMTKGLDQVMWSTWKVLSPRSEIKGSGEVTRAMGSYASGSDGVGIEDVQRSVERLRQLSASLVSAISQTGRQFAQQHADRFGPEQIEAWSAREKKSLEGSASVCWRKYKEMYGNSDQATIEREIMQQIADYGERLMSGLDRVEKKG